MRSTRRSRRANRIIGSLFQAAGAIRIGNTIGAAITNRRLLEPVESRLMLLAGLVLLALAILSLFLPAILVYPVAVLSAWSAIALVYKSYTLHNRRTSDSLTTGIDETDPPSSTI